mgnify:CR=1 FL=1
MSRVFLGAINKITGEYVYPTLANKMDEYICPCCSKSVFPRQGKVLSHHFAHKQSDNPCNYYNHPNESDIHKDAKMLLQLLLKDNNIYISCIRTCISCKKDDEFSIPNVDEKSIIKIEYSFDYNGSRKSADVAYIQEEDLVCIFEICNTHKTHSKNRPEPWFEIDAEELIEMVNNKTRKNKLQIPCIRSEVCDDCIERKRLFESGTKEDVKIKSDFYEADSYPSYSKECMEIFISIICGDYSYKQWCDDRYDIVLCHTGEENFDKVFYDEDLIQDIKNMHLYKYLQKLYIEKKHLEFYFYSENMTSDNMHNIITKITLICRQLFGIEADYYTPIVVFSQKQRQYDIIREYTTNIDDTKYVYFKVPFNKKYYIKKFGGKWNNEEKLWFIKNIDYEKHSDYIDNNVGDKIHWYQDKDKLRLYSAVYKR